MVVGIFLLAGSTAARAQTSLPGALCSAAIGTVQQERATPRNLLAAIALVESGRCDPRSGTLTPWPWTIDAGGRPAVFQTKAEAVAAVRTLQASGVQSIDVGCMQVNLQQHPAAFSTLEAAFDPLTNVRYAAVFLNSLFGRTGRWPAATSLYHSATPTLGAAYRRRVMANWPGVSKSAKLVGSIQTPLARAWAATLSGNVGL